MRTGNHLKLGFCPQCGASLSAPPQILTDVAVEPGVVFPPGVIPGGRK